VQVKRIAANSCDAKLERSFIAISRCQAAQQKAEKRLSGVPRKGVRLSEASAYCEQHPSRGYKLRAVPLCGTKWLAALFGSFLGKLSIISSFVC